MLRARRALEWAARANLLLAVSMAAATWMLYVLLEMPVQPRVPAIVGLVFYGVYAMDRAADHGDDAHTHLERARFSRAHAGRMWGTALTAYAAALVLAVPLGVRGVAAALLPIAALLLYSFRLVPPWLARRIGVSRVKEVLVLKNVWVAATLAGTPTLLMAAARDAASGAPALWPAAAFLFGRWWINTLLFDVRDEAGDRRNGLRTVPVALGRARTLRLLHAANAALGAAVLAAALSGAIPARMALLAASSLYAAWYLHRMQAAGDPHFLCDVVADGELLVQAGVVLA
ncbi:MAG TPA: UbiA family prenyltransferase, partial [Longimicrobiaceae bacterium]|nr:UbiA family prenyltransferase [Longimicrobiaceae bacterium]